MIKLNEAFKLANLDKNNIDEIILVGGSSKNNITEYPESTIFDSKRY